MLLLLILVCPVITRKPYIAEIDLTYFKIEMTPYNTSRILTMFSDNSTMQLAKHDNSYGLSVGFYFYNVTISPDYLVFKKDGCQFYLNDNVFDIGPAPHCTDFNVTAIELDQYIVAFSNIKKDTDSVINCEQVLNPEYFLMLLGFPIIVAALSMYKRLKSKLVRQIEEFETCIDEL